MISVLVPYRPDGGHRDRAWNWIRERWELFFGDTIEILVGGDDGGRNPGEFNHPLAINRLAAKASHDVFVIADADTAFDAAWLVRAVKLVRHGDAAWVLPTQYRKLTEKATQDVLAYKAPEGALAMCDTEWVGESVSWSGQVVISREAFETVGGYDERFAFWGADDSSFAAAVSTLVAPVCRLEGACYHFWHQVKLEETYGHERHPEQYQLNMRYLDAWGDVDEMRKVRFG